MKNILTFKTWLMAAIAVAGSVISSALGGWDSVTKVLVSFMVVDYITGFLVAAIWYRSNKSESGRLDSRAGFKGLVRKGAILAVVYVAHELDMISTGTPYIRNAVCLFFIGNEGLSLLENLGIMGVPFPKFLKDALEALKDHGDEGETE